MEQQQSIGNSNQQQGADAEPQTTATSNKGSSKPASFEPAKPQFTDDQGNIVSKESNTANGYNEKKPTDPGSNVKETGDDSPVNTPPENQPAESEKVYGQQQEPSNTLFTGGNQNNTQTDTEMEQQRKEAQSERD